MARQLWVTCDCGCDAMRDGRGPRPKTWWLLEQQSEQQTTGPLDFASLTCLIRWLDRHEVRAAYPLDFDGVLVKDRAV